ncbi:PREDICTED: dynactin subunit 3-like [Priapulus caudatus]|uniref:Dynactin subunit 3-like n=1 Tax=Priapulus caudatus TaxID=37621 RepID=A0ABM1DUL0_PRICU|nr:PREDICTED: dynactin subunit 3-like [Priapulus caudatus]
MSDMWLGSIENRIDVLENRVFGKADKDAEYPKCVNTLTAVNKRLTAATKGREKVNQCMKRLYDIEKYIDPEYGNTLLLPQTAKLEVILDGEDRIRDMVSQLDKLEILKHVLNSEHIKATPALAEKLQNLNQIHLQQQDQGESITEETKQLIDTYNSLTTTISKQFIQWNTILQTHEAELSDKKKSK